MVRQYRVCRGSGVPLRGQGRQTLNQWQGKVIFPLPCLLAKREFRAKSPPKNR